MSKFIDNLSKKFNCKGELSAKRKSQFFFDYQFSENLFNDAEIKHLYFSSPFLEPPLPKFIERKLLEISEREQRRIGQDLHDSIGQILTGISFISKALEQKLAAKLSVEAGQATIITKLVNEAMISMSRLVRTLNPINLESDGFILALEELAESIKKTFDISCRISLDHPVFISDNSMATHLYRIVQEAINNAIRHGKAENIDIEIRSSNKRLIVAIKDDGVGFPPVLESKKGMGLNIMKYRAGMIGASLSIRKGPKGGTIVKCSVKL